MYEGEAGCIWDEVRVYRCGCMSVVGDIMTLEFTIIQWLRGKWSNV